MDTRPAPTTGNSPIGQLIDCAGDLKKELLEFAYQPQFAKQLGRRLQDAASNKIVNEGTLARVVDHFALQHRLPDGHTVAERFVAQRRPRLSDPEREMVLGWLEVAEGIFEVGRRHGDAITLHNLLDDLAYEAYSNLGPTVFDQLTEGMFLSGRIVPIHPATDAWMISGHLAVYVASDVHRVARTAVELVTSNPRLLRRNPVLLQRAWDIQAQHRTEFIAQFGSDLVVLPPSEARQALSELFRRLQQKALDNAEDRAAAPEELSPFPDELLDADSVALIFDEVEGLAFCRDFGRVDALFADPTLARDRTHIVQLRDYLNDDSIPPMAIRRLVQRHPNGADAVLRTFLGKPRFSWSRDGEQLLRQRKRKHFDREPAPSVSVVGRRLADLRSLPPKGGAAPGSEKMG
jgi:hypothetical protein